jgi:hypothetical protein
MEHNLYYDQDNELKWKVNFTAVFNNFRDIIGFSYKNSALYTGPVCVLVGELSHHWDRDCFNFIFPNYNVDEIHLVKGACKFFLIKLIGFI